MTHWTIYRRCGQWDDTIVGPDTPAEGIVVEAPQYTADENAFIAKMAMILQGLCEEGRDGQSRDITLEVLSRIQTKAASLAFMEVSRDA